MSRHRSPVPARRSPHRALRRFPAAPRAGATAGPTTRPSPAPASAVLIGTAPTHTAPTHTPPTHTTPSVAAPTTELDLAAIATARRARAGYTPDVRGRPSPPAGRSGTHAAPSSGGVRGPGLLAAGAATVALAALAPAAVGLPTGDATLELSAQDTRLAPAPSGSAVAPVVMNGAGTTADPATADLFKAGDRTRRQAEQAQATAQAAQARATAQAAQAADAARARAETERAARVTSCGADSDYGGVADSVQTVGNALECVFPGHDLLGVGSRGNASDHPGGYALDLMTRDGDAIAECVTEHADALGVSYAIWNQQINTGSGWEDMEDRGGDTANHRDHVHVSFSRDAVPDVTALRSCG